MLNSIEEFLNEQEVAFAQCEDFLPRMERIKEADKIGKEILKFVNENIENINFDILNDIDVSQIIEDLDLNINTELDGDVLIDIYEEIEQTFHDGGRVSLEDYLNQGEVVYNDMLYELKGSVDYSISYSEKQLKDEEKKAFERFNLVLSMKNFEKIASCLDLSSIGISYLDKTTNYLDSLKSLDSSIRNVPYAGTIEEKISEINYTILLVSSLESLECKIKDKISLNEFFSEKVNLLLPELSKYHEDKNIKNQFNEMLSTVKKYSESEISKSLLDKLEKIQEKIYERDKVKDNSTSTGLG